MGHFGVGLKLYPTRNFFVRPEAHLYLVNDNQEFSSARAVRYGISIGYTFGRRFLQQLKPHLQGGMRLAWATKGFEQATGKLPHEIAAEVLGERWPIAVLSGPTFAREVGAGLPTAMTVASPDETFAAAIARNISGLNFRAYTPTTSSASRSAARSRTCWPSARALPTAWATARTRASH